MTMRPQPEAIPMPHDPCPADSQAAHLALQEYAADSAAAPGKGHDHILRAALLANGCTVKEPYTQ